MSGDVAKLEVAQSAPAPQMNDGAVILTMIDKLLARPDVPVEKLEQMFSLHQKVQAEAARREYLAAFSALQAGLPAVARRGKGHNDKRYARFEDVIGAVRDKLSEHGFSLSFRIHHEGSIVRITGVLGHSAGHQETTDLPLPADKSGSKNDVQAWGSAISYGKRYVALTLLGLATEDDDDGSKAGDKPTDATLDEIMKLIDDTKSDRTWFLTNYSVETFDDLNGRQRDEIKSKLTAKLAHTRRTNARS